MNVLVIDVGTSSMRGILYDKNAKEQRKVQIQYSPDYINEFLVEQNPLDWKSALIKICKNISSEDGSSVSIDAISITSQRSSVIPLSKSYEPIAPAIMWQDKRTLELCRSLSVYNDTVIKKSGSRINPVYSAGKMAWLKMNRPQIYHSAAKLVVIPDYLIHTMTGVLATDHTYGSRSLLMNIKTMEWDKDLLSIWNIDREKLCELVKPGTAIGTISPEFARLTGIQEGIPVISAGGDQQCSALGQGVIASGSTQVTAGTGAYIISASDSAVDLPRGDVILGASSVSGQYILESSIPTCCSAFNWFHNCFYPLNDTDYSMINDEIASSGPTDHGPIVLPHFQGRGTPDWNSSSTATFHNITLSTGRGDMVRALLEGIGFEIKANLDIIQGYLPSCSRIVLSGGLTKCSPFPAMLSGILGTPVVLYSNTESTALGAWMAAAVSCGIYSDYHTAYQKSRENDPMKEFHPLHTVEYDKKYSMYQELYQKLYSNTFSPPADT